MEKKQITITFGKQNKKVQMPSNFEELKKASQDKYASVKEPFKFQYEKDGILGSVGNEADFIEFKEKQIPKLVVIQLEKEVQVPSFEVIYLEKRIKVQQHQELSNFIEECKLKFQLGDVIFNISYQDQEGDQIDIEDESDYSCFLEEQLNTALILSTQETSQTPTPSDNQTQQDQNRSASQENGGQTLLQKDAAATENIQSSQNFNEISLLKNQNNNIPLEQSENKIAENQYIEGAKSQSIIDQNAIIDQKVIIDQNDIIDQNEKVAEIPQSISQQSRPQPSQVEETPPEVNCSNQQHQIEEEKKSQSTQESQERNENEFSQATQEVQPPEEEHKISFDSLTPLDQKLYNNIKYEPLEIIKEEYLHYVSKNQKLQFTNFLKQQFPQICEEKQKTQNPMDQLIVAFDALLKPDQNNLNQFERKRISIKNFEQFAATLTPDKTEQIYQFCQLQIDKRLASGQDFNTLFTQSLFVQDPQHPLHSFDDYKLMTFFAQRLRDKSARIFSLYSKIPGKPLPFAFRSSVNPQILMIPLSSYQEILTSDTTNLIQIGPSKCGKSKLLNKMFVPVFQLAEDLDSNEYPLHYGVQLICSSDQFNLGFHTFDFNMNFSSHLTERKEEAYEIMNLLECFPKKCSKIILHTISEEDLQSNLSMLLEKGWDISQIMILIRDCQVMPRGFKMILEELSIDMKSQVKCIRKIEKTTVFEAELNILRVECQNWGIIDEKQEHNYYLFEQCAQNLNGSFQITFVSEDDKKFEAEIKKQFSSVMLLKDNDLHKEIFRAIEIRNKINFCKKQIEDAEREEDEDKRHEIMTKFNEQKKSLEEQLQLVSPHELICVFDDVIKQKNLKKLSIFEAQLGIWQKPIISPKLKQRMQHVEKNQEIEKKLIKHNVAQNEIKNDQSKFETYKKDLLTEVQIKNFENDQKKLQEAIRQISKDIDKLSISKEHFFRELDFLYEINKGQNPQNSRFSNKVNYLDSYVSYVKQGCEFEFIDGENNLFHEDTVTEILNRVEEGDQTSPFVISIIGPQSTGKSTLLNFLFNTSFLVSAGRCTKGMYASIFETDYEKAKRILVLDSEGLLSIEKNDPAYDKKITTLGMALSQVLLINVMGDFNQAMKEILAMSLLAGNQLRVFIGKRPILIFVLRNCIDDDISKMREIVSKIEDELRKVAETVNVELHDIVDFRGQESFCLMYSAYNKDDFTYEGRKLYSFCIVNDSFRNKSVQLLQKIFQEAENPKLDRHADLSIVAAKARDFWGALGSYNQLLGFKSIEDMNNRKQLKEIVDNIRKQLVEHDSSKEENNFTSLTQELKILLDKKDEEISIEIEIGQLKDSYIQYVTNSFHQSTKSKQFSKELLNDYEQRLVMCVLTPVQRALDENKRKSIFSAILKEVNQKKKKINDSMENLLTNYETLLEKADEQGKEKLCKQIEGEFKQQMKKLQVSLDEGIEKHKKNYQGLCTDVFKFLKDVIYQESQSGITFLNQQHLDKAKKEIIEKRNNYIDNIFMTVEDRAESYDQVQVIDFLKSIIHYDYNYFMHKALSKSAMSSVDLEENIEKIKPRQDGMIDKITHFFFGKKIKNAPLTSDQMKRSNNNNRYQASQLVGQKTEDQKQQQITENFEKLIFKTYQDCGPYVFVELSQFLKQKLKTIINSQGITISFMQTVLKQIEELLHNLEDYYLKQNQMYFNKGTIEQYIAKILFYGLQQNFELTQELKIKREKESFQEEIDKMIELFNAKLKSYLGDKENASMVSLLMYNTLLEQALQQSNKKLLELLEANTLKDPVALIDIGNRILDSDYKNKQQDFIDWATNVSVYNEKIFDQEFEKTKVKYQKQNYGQQKNDLMGKYNQLVEALNNTIQVIMQIKELKIAETINENHQEAAQKLLFQIFINFLCKPSELKSTISNLNALIHDQINQVSVEQVEDLAKIYATNHFDVAALFGQKVDIVKNSKIRNLLEFAQSVFKNIQNKKKDIQKWSETTLKEQSLTEEQINKIIFHHKQDALGCKEVCPYCGAKCTEENGHQKHKTNRHRIMGLRGSHKVEGGEIKLLDVCCTSIQAQKSFWRDSKEKQSANSTNQNIDASLRQMITNQNCTMGTLNFTLAWSDPNDLDLFITCPCGYVIGLGGQCSTCGGQSDCDMNFTGRQSATAPMEHVYFGQNAQDGVYKIWVRQFKAEKTHEGITGGSSSTFYVKAHSGDEIYQEWSSTLYQDQNANWTFNYSKKPQHLKFYDHCLKYYSNWTITQGDSLDQDLHVKCIAAMDYNKEQIKKATKLI